MADPPLAQVVSHTYQAGLRGDAGLGDGKLDWSASLFRTDSDNDIVALASTIAGPRLFHQCALHPAPGRGPERPLSRRRAGRPMPAIPIWTRPISSPAPWPRPTIPAPTPTAM